MNKTGLKSAERYSLDIDKQCISMGFSEQEVVNFETNGNRSCRRARQTNEVKIVQSTASRMR
ncbi:hypothetical protein D3C74_393600 [compost metagenome]